MADPMDHNNHVSVNWRVINVPSLVAIAGLLVTMVGVYGSFVSRLERQDARMDATDKDRANNALLYGKQMDLIQTTMSAVVTQGNKTEYRVTVAEQGIVALGSRQDRFADALGDLRDGIAGVKTSIEVLTEKIETSLPMKRSELEFTPPQLKRN